MAVEVFAGGGLHEDGLHEVINPSQVFLEERLQGATGSAGQIDWIM